MFLSPRSEYQRKRYTTYDTHQKRSKTVVMPINFIALPDELQFIFTEPIYLCVFVEMVQTAKAKKIRYRQDDRQSNSELNENEKKWYWRKKQGLQSNFNRNGFGRKWDISFEKVQ